MNERSISIFLLMISCLLSLTCAYAQQREKSSNGGEEDLEWWVHDAANPNNEALLFKALWFDDQNPRLTDSLEVYCNGRTFQAHTSIMGTGPSGFSTLSPQQVAAIKQIVFDLKPPLVAGKQGQKHTAVILMNNGNYIRYDYWGMSIQPFVSKIKSIVDSGIQSPEYPFDKGVDPGLLFAPEELRSCVAGNTIALETLPKDELLKRAFHRYLYPSERYAILKVYLRRFPADTDDIANLLKRWVAAYESAQK